MDNYLTVGDLKKLLEDDDVPDDYRLMFGRLEGSRLWSMPVPLIGVTNGAVVFSLDGKEHTDSEDDLPHTTKPRPCPYTWDDDE